MYFTYRESFWYSRQSRPRVSFKLSSPLLLSLPSSSRIFSEEMKRGKIHSTDFRVLARLFVPHFDWYSWARSRAKKKQRRKSSGRRKRNSEKRQRNSKDRKRKRERKGCAAVYFARRSKMLRSTAINFGIVVGIISFGSRTTECSSRLGFAVASMTS